MNLARPIRNDDLASRRPAPSPLHPRSIAIVTDAWHPQTNGVVRTLSTTAEILRARGHEVTIISPQDYRSIPCPTYAEIRLALAPPGAVARRLAELGADAVHIATEGPLGHAARRWCLKHGVPFTTAYHTQFPDYLARRTHLPARVFWPFVRRFHAPARRIMVATESIREELREHDLNQLHHWSRGVDLACFTYNAPPPPEYAGLPGPILLYAGRVAVEKNLEAFLACNYPGTKVVVGDGPARASLEKRFWHAKFLGKRTGRELAGCYAGADVFVFPSRTDTFGLVMIEAMACGTPVAAFPVTGPVDVLPDGGGVMHEKLETAIAGALRLDRATCREHGKRFSWEASATQFVAGLAPIGATQTASQSAPLAA